MLAPTKNLLQFSQRNFLPFCTFLARLANLTERTIGLHTQIDMDKSRHIACSGCNWWQHLHCHIATLPPSLGIVLPSSSARVTPIKYQHLESVSDNPDSNIGPQISSKSLRILGMQYGWKLVNTEWGDIDGVMGGQSGQDRLPSLFTREVTLVQNAPSSAWCHVSPHGTVHNIYHQ